MTMHVQRPGPGTPVTVVGLARSGVAAARWLLELGCLVRLTEKGRSPSLEETARELASAGARVELGTHSRGFIDGSHLVVVSPGVPLASAPIRWAREAGIPVVSELELGSWYCPGNTVAVTGSNGKSTVVTLVGEILRAVGREVAVCGNIGTPLCGELHRITASTVVVLEVSSFQLETNLSFHSQIACLLNVTNNHLDRHGSMERYAAAKAKLFAYQKRTSWGILNADNPLSWSMKRHIRGRLAAFSRRREVAVGGFVKEGWLRLNGPGFAGPICQRDALLRAGAHHEENALAASFIAGLLGAPPQVSGQVLRSFRGLPHRQEVVATIHGITFVNDSKSTTVASGLRAIEAAPGRVILIAGGRDKGSDFRELKAATPKLKAAVVIGEDGPKIAAHLKGTLSIVKAGDLREAVHASFQIAQKGEVVLLSPMCTSFDMFRDFEERGEKFLEAVQALQCAL